MTKKILIIANTSWYIKNFRENTIRDLISRGYEVHCMAPDNVHKSFLISLGVKFTEYYLKSSSINFIQELFSLYSIFKNIFLLKPQVVLSFNPKPNMYSSLICRLLGIPSIVNISGLGLGFKHKYAIVRFITKSMYRLTGVCSNHVFTQNQADYNIFTEDFKLCENKVDLLPGSGVDLNKFQFKSLPRSKKIRFGFFARLIEEKGLRVLIDAIKSLNSNNILDFEVIVAGATEFDRTNAITQNELDSWVNAGLINYVGYTESVSKYIALCHSVILPTYYPEGTPKILIEAASMGRVIITTEQPGCSDSVNEDSGFLIPIRSSAHLAECMEKVINIDEVNMKKMGLSARKHAEQGFDERIVLEKYLRVVSRFT